MDAICSALERWSPDVVALQEVRERSVGPLEDRLRALGVRHLYRPDGPAASDNTQLVGCRTPFDAGDFLPDRAGACHILEAEMAGFTLLAAHFPQKGAQVPLFEALLQDSASLLALPALLLGDLNCGLPFEDSTDKTFVNAKYFQALKEAGWIDLYRRLHGPDAREFSWISPRTGRGFRYDHALASPGFAVRAARLEYDHAVRESGASDHSALVLDVNL